MPAVLDRARLDALMEREQAAFSAANPRSLALFERARGSLLAGVPMNWMVKWAGSFPLFVESASGAHFRDVDGHDYVDFCLGDTGAMTGHGPAATIAAVEAQLPRGITHMLPTEDAIAVGEELQRRFGLHVVAVHPLGDRRQPLRHPAGPDDHGPTEGALPRLLLPRLGGRVVRDADRGRAGRGAAGQHRPGGGPGGDHPAGAVQRPRRRSSASWRTATSRWRCSSRR